MHLDDQDICSLAQLTSPIDPYLLWALCTDFAAFPIGPHSLIPLLIELVDPFDPASPDQLCKLLRIPTVYAETLGHTGRTARYVTGRVGRCELLQVLRCRSIRRLQLGLPRIRETVELTPYTKVREILGRGAIPLTVFGIVDDGMAIAHPALRQAADQTASRVVALWDQNADRQSDQDCWGALPIMGYGAALTPPPIGPGPRGEAAFYRRIRYLDDISDPRGSRAHGTAVAGIAVGHPSPGRPAGTTRLEPDCASHVQVVAVQLPAQTMQDTSGGSLAVHVLDGVRYVLWMAEARVHDAVIKRQPDTRVVVNLSLGGSAGPHDGHSMLDEAFDELIGQRGNLAITQPAGNARTAGVHALLEAPAAAGGKPGVGAPACIKVLPDDPTDNFLELWIDHTVVDDIRVRLHAPDGSRYSVAVGSITVFGPDRGWAHAVFCRSPAQSPGKALLLLAIAPTVHRAGRAWQRHASPAGTWSIALENAGSRPVGCHAWIERDDMIGRQPRPQQTRFTADARAGSHFNLNSIAHGDRSVVVAGHVRSGGQPADYSSSGPGVGLRGGPDASAVSDDGYASPGVAVAGTRSWFRSERMAGTSVAAPRIARWLLNHDDWDAPRKAVQIEAARQDSDAAKPGTPVPPAQRIGAGRFSG